MTIRLLHKWPSPTHRLITFTLQQYKNDRVEKKQTFCIYVNSMNIRREDYVCFTENSSQWLWTSVLRVHRERLTWPASSRSAGGSPAAPGRCGRGRCCGPPAPACWVGSEASRPAAPSLSCGEGSLVGRKPLKGSEITGV